MKTERIEKSFNAAQLHTELVAIGVPVVTVRASSDSMNGPSHCGVVVVEDSADSSIVKKVIENHVHSGEKAKLRTMEERTKTLEQMEKL